MMDFELAQKASSRLFRNRYFNSIGVQSGDELLMQNAQSDLFDKLTSPAIFTRFPE
jgi:hypothetical protein